MSGKHEGVELVNFDIAEMMSVISPGSSNKKGNQSNSPSKLLSQEENETLFRIMGARCQAQVSAVVQVFVTEPPNHSAWKKLHCGVATFTKDNSRRSYFIQVYDIIKEQKLLEQELYNLFAYYVSLPFFHQFEGENQMIGLNFADNQEAEGFGKVITDRLEAKQRKREEKRRQQQMEINTQQPPTPQPSHQRQTFSGQQNNIQHSYTNNSNISNKNRGRKGKKANKIRKDQIGEPTNFQHITHVGFDQDRGFSSFNANEELNEFFKMAGVSQNLLQDDNTRRFIYDFIDQHGGVERAAQETKVYGSIRRAPSVAEKAGPPPPPPPPNVDSTPQPPNKPALPSRNSNAGSNPPPPPPPRPHLNNHPHVAPPPPPPKDKNLAEKDVAPSAPATGSGSHSNAPPPPPPPRIPPAPGGGGGAPTPPRISNGEGAPVPPPPPPPPVTSSGGGGSNAPPMPSNAPPMPSNVPPMPSNAVVDSNTRNDLLAQIRQRPTLNPVSQLKIEKPEKDSRTTLMSEIRNREYELKPVIVQEGDASPGAPPVENSMAAMLARALEGRAKAMQDESDDEEDEEEDEDEWDDN